MFLGHYYLLHRILESAEISPISTAAISCLCVSTILNPGLVNIQLTTYKSYLQNLYIVCKSKLHMTLTTSSYLMCINLQVSSLDGGTGGTSRPPLVVQQCLRPGRTLSPWTLQSSATVDICLLSVLPYCTIWKVRESSYEIKNKASKGRMVKSKRLFLRFGCSPVRITPK